MYTCHRFRMINMIRSFIRRRKCMFLTLLSPKTCDSEAGFLIGSFSHIPRPFWRLEMHQSTLVTARWFASWFEASTWVFFYNQSVCCSRSTDVLCVIYIYICIFIAIFFYIASSLYIGRWCIKKSAAGLDAQLPRLFTVGWCWFHAST